MELCFEPYVRYISKTAYFIENKQVVANDCRILYIISGGGNFEHGNKSHKLNPGTLVYYPYGVPYRITSENGMMFYTVNFDFDRSNMNVTTMIPQPTDDYDPEKTLPSIPKYMQETFNSVLCFENAFWAEKTIRSIYHEALDKKFGFVDVQSSYLKILLIRIFRYGINDNSTNDLCRKIKTLIFERCDLNNKSLAQILGYHPFYLNCIFKKSEKMTLHKYIFRQRLIKAYELVNTTDKSLEEIAEMCGFSSQSHLSTAFKKEYGISPGKLRLS
jgi:AraC-like DNA-binding protein